MSNQSATVLAEAKQIMTARMSEIFATIDPNLPVEDAMEVLRDRLLSMVYNNT